MADDPAPSGATPDPGATPGPEHTPQDSQQHADDLGEGGKRALAEMRRQAREATQQRDELAQRLKAIEDADKSELERAQSTLSEHELTIAARDARIAELEHEAMARTAAADAGISQHWQRLRGATPEELAADADALVTEIGGGAQRAPSADLGSGARPPGSATGHDGMNALIRNRRR
jgi:hypothetical protein